MIYCVKNEVSSFVNKKKALELARNVNPQSILASERRGKKAIGILLKNNLTTFFFQSLIWEWYYNEEIGKELLTAALRYNKDFLAAIKDNSAKPNYLVCYNKYKRTQNEPSQLQIEASIRIYKAKDALLKQSIDQDYIYLKLVELFLEKESSLNQISKLIKRNKVNTKRLILEMLNLIKDFYYPDKNNQISYTSSHSI